MLKKNKLNILILSFIFSPNIGGVESHLDELCDYLLKRKCKITVITYKPIIGNIKAPFISGKKNLLIYRIPWIGGNLFNKLITHPILQVSYLTPVIFVFSLLFLLLNYKKVDIIQSHGFNMAIVAYVLNMLTGKPYTVNTHVSFSFKNNNFYSKILVKILNKSSKVLVLTDDSREELIKIGVKREKIRIYHYWVDDFFRPCDKIIAREKLGLDKNKFIVIFIGRFIKEKGVSLLLNTFKKMPLKNELIMIGSGPLESEILKKAKNISNIKIYSSIKRTDFPEWYSAADLTIIPSFNASNIYSEGIPRVMIESLFCETPVISTKAGGLKSMLTEEIGYFIEPNIKSISKLITKLSSKRTELVKMGKLARLYAKTKFSLSKNANKIYLSLIN